MTSALDGLRALPSPAELNKDSKLGVRRSTPAAFNSHVHLPPNFSAFANAAQAVGLASTQGCVLLGTSNYYDFAVYDEFASHCQASGIFPLFGLEMLCRDEALARRGVRVNDPGNPGKVYLCGKGISRFEPFNARAGAIMAGVRARDGARIAEMVGRCVATLAERGCVLHLTADSILDDLVRRYRRPRSTVVLQERHVAQAIQEALFAAIPAGERLARFPSLLGGVCKMKDPDDAVGVQNEVRNHLTKAGKPAFVPESYIDLVEAKTLALELGGIPCYPVLVDGANPVSEFEATPRGLVANVKQLGIWATEFIPNRNVPSLLVDYVKRLRGEGLVVTAGTEHNTLELLPIMPSTKSGPIPAELLPVFWEGACVVAAHQYLVSRGEPGYVGPEGVPHPAYPDSESRIAAFAALGEAVIAAFRTRRSASAPDTAPRMS
jgi:hypothetical protein